MNNETAAQYLTAIFSAEVEYRYPTFRKCKANVQCAPHKGSTKSTGFSLFMASLPDAAKTTIFKIGKPN